MKYSCGVYRPKSGDRVKYVGSFSYSLMGATGTVEFISDDTVYVDWDDELAKPSGVFSNNLALGATLPKETTALEDARKLVYGDRQEDYGHPWDDFTRTAKLWSEVLGIEVTPEQYALCMILVKVSRLVNDPTKRDSWVDLAGYAECYDRLQTKRKELENEKC